MRIRQMLVAGIVSGLIMGITLFIAGAIFSRIIYGPQMAPPGKFDAEQMNAWYFIWTKLLIGIFFGLLYSFIYEKLPLTHRLRGGWHGAAYGFVFWMAFSLWNVSHPLVYGSFDTQDELFWLIYTMWGFLALGFSFGRFQKRFASRTKDATVGNGTMAPAES